MAKKTPVKKATTAPKKAAKKKAVRKAKTNGGQDLVDSIVNAIKEKKGQFINVLDLRKIGSSVADFFVVCHGSSKTNVDAIAQSVEEIVFKELKIWPSHSEGYENGEWILLDYFDVIAHVFLEEKRDFYKIEKLWADAELKSA